MHKITKLSVVTLCALPLFGMIQPLVAHAYQVGQPSCVKTQQRAGTDVVSFGDNNVRTAVMTALNVSNPSDLTIDSLKSFTGNIDLSNQKVTSLEGVNYLSGMYFLNLKNCDLSQEVFNQLDFTEKSFNDNSYGLYNIKQLNISGNHLYDTSSTGLAPSNFPNVDNSWEGNQTYSEPLHYIGDTKTLVLDINKYKDRNGSGAISIDNKKISNGGTYDSNAKTITWKNLDPSKISQVSFNYYGTSYLDGIATVPIASGRGIGQTQVTYNTNPMTPDDPTANPDFAVFIPTSYSLSDTNLKTAAPGQVALKTASDFSAYQGSAKVDVTVTSQNNFTFSNGGTYQLVGGDGKTPLPSPITLSSTVSSSPVNVLLTKAGRKTSATDLLDFNYQAHY